MEKEWDKIYMKRALELAAYGAGHVSPNPMVGCVIVSAAGRIIGEGWHRRYGEGHAEVNAMASVRKQDEPLLHQATVYVTLEPCSHYGKTPPCAEMLCRKKVKRVVSGMIDPNPKVAGRGLRMLEDSGIEVESGVLEDECRALNIRFITAQTKRRPWILLKWAEDAYGRLSLPDTTPLQISTPLSATLMHAQRSCCDAIMVGTNTLLTDNPSLSNRLWPGNSPRPVIFKSERIENLDLKVMQQNPIILNPHLPLEQNMKLLFEEYRITSLMVEGGRRLLDSFICEGLYDSIRIEREINIDHNTFKIESE
ncbi:MAG: bifunctional diaminohydroxyphosphoribosylaminopyrimidine deaminase/5-amino-6-(5-phosphoribosylamino)uracil reductase RibD [Muribaculaceae bacterium]|nr:bifunctional diaminohydroxyphosphoribosylaminopyrimidine deaminase/5-amino-6-(5-phosphoribosylamino)uracil reductase RibD [Muribaculaceae bacterium]